MLNDIPRTEIDPFDPEVILNSHHVMGELREQAPWVYIEKYGVYATGRQELATKMLRDWKSFTSTIKAWGPRPLIPAILVAEDPPVHTRSRDALMQFFSPVALRGYQATFETYAEKWADELVQKGDVCGTEDVAAGFVLRVFADILGMQDIDRGRLLIYGDLMFNSVCPSNELYKKSFAASGDIHDWFAAQFKRENLRKGGLADQIYALGDDGTVPVEDAGQLVKAVFSAGFDTTVLSIGSGLKYFADNPAEWDKLRADPTLIKGAFEETIRYDAPSRVLGRGVNNDMEFGGLQLKAGDKVACFLNACGRDPRKWGEDADDFHIDRKGVLGHVSFGHGIHSCLGQALARLEFQAIIGALAKRVARIEPTAPATRVLNNQACGFSQVPVRLVAA